MDKVTHQVRCEQWTKIINECLASGMNKTAWCKANGISDKSFFYWQRILRNEAYATTKHLPVPIEAKKETSVTFVELKPTTTYDLPYTNIKSMGNKRLRNQIDFARNVV